MCVCVCGVCVHLVLSQDVVRKVEGVEKGANDKPSKDVVVAASGVLPVDGDIYVDKE